jgi:predicted branched-subunit amino acid permease
VVGCSLSLSAFAGSLELLVVGMIASTAPLAAIAITVFVVNFRHVFYAFSFPRHLVRNRFGRLYATYAMIDEVYAVNAALPKSHQSAAGVLSMQVACQIYWVGGGLAGVLIARSLPGPIKGLDSRSVLSSPCSPWTHSGLVARSRWFCSLERAWRSPSLSLPGSPCSARC